MFILSITISLFSNAYGEEISVDDDNIKISITSINDETRSNMKLHSLTYNGTKVKLYRTFDNKEQAIENIKQKSSSILYFLSCKYSLDEINDSNWNDYRDAMNSSIYTCEHISYNQLSNLKKFFDIYENDDMNNEILDYIYKNNGEVYASSCIDLKLLLPYDVDNNYNALNNNVTTSSTSFINKCVEYATKYAESRNDAYHSFIRGDCTNFMSQILEYAGIKQEVYESEYSGWWHKVTKNVLGIKTHKHSRSWTMADTFCKYMGVTYTTDSNFAFSAHVEKGDFVACDDDHDGNWNHMGFVVARDSSPGTYDGKKYYDYKIAQHTSDYLLWASSPDNHWDNNEDEQGKYAIVRR